MTDPKLASLLERLTAQAEKEAQATPSQGISIEERQKRMAIAKDTLAATYRYLTEEARVVNNALPSRRDGFYTGKNLDKLRGILALAALTLLSQLQACGEE